MHVCQLDTIIIAFFILFCQGKTVFFNNRLVFSKRAVLYPRSKERGFRTEVLDKNGGK